MFNDNNNFTSSDITYAWLDLSTNLTTQTMTHESWAESSISSDNEKRMNYRTMARNSSAHMLSSKMFTGVEFNGHHRQSQIATSFKWTLKFEWRIYFSGMKTNWFVSAGPKQPMVDGEDNDNGNGNSDGWMINNKHIIIIISWQLSPTMRTCFKWLVSEIELEA